MHDHNPPDLCCRHYLERLHHCSQLCQAPPRVVIVQTRGKRKPVRNVCNQKCVSSLREETVKLGGVFLENLIQTIPVIGMLKSKALKNIRNLIRDGCVCFLHPEPVLSLQYMSVESLGISLKISILIVPALLLRSGIFLEGQQRMNENDFMIS